MKLINPISEEPKIVLVTGAAGFIGRQVSFQAHKQGFNVFGVGHGSISNEEMRVLGISKFVNSGITIDSLCSLECNPAIVIHCASSASVAFSISNPTKDFSRSVESTLSVLEYLRIFCPAAKLVLPSSAAVYGSSKIFPLKPTYSLKPISPYGLHKKFSEELCLNYGKCFGIRSSIVRLFSIYGPGLRKQLFWDACNKLSSGKRLFGGSGLESRDWLHVDDASALLITASRFASEIPPIVNGGTSIKTSISDALLTIAREIPNSSLPTFSGAARSGDPQNLVADITEALEWGWAPQYKLKEGISQYVKWFLSEK